MSNKTELQSNNNDLQGILNIINGLPAANTNELPTLSKPATVDKVLSGYDYIDGDGNQKVGTIPIKAVATYGAKTSDQTISSGQYLSGTQTIKKVEQSGLTAANIVKGKTVTIKSNGSNLWNVTGTAETNYSDGKYYIVNNGTLGNQVYGGTWSQQNGYVQVSFSSSIGYKDIGNYIDLTDFSTLTIELSSVSVDGTSRTRTFYIMDTNGDLVADVGLAGANVSKTATIDVSSLTGFHLFRPRGSYSSMRIKNLYLS